MEKFEWTTPDTAGVQVSPIRTPASNHHVLVLGDPHGVALAVEGELAALEGFAVRILVAVNDAGDA